MISHFEKLSTLLLISTGRNFYYLLLEAGSQVEPGTASASMSNSSPSAALRPMPTSRHCPACGMDTEQLHYFDKWGYAIVKCAACGLGSTSVDPGFDPLSIYSSDYFQGQMKDGYVDYAGSEVVLRREFARLINWLRSRGRSSGRLLEIGCAYGFFLAEAGRQFEVYGIEVNATAVQFCRSRGLDVERGIVDEDYLRRKGPFDVVVMFDVIEHLSQPDEVLRLIYRYLRPGGHLLITTGDWDSWLSRMMKSSWRLMTPPQHLFFFSGNTLSKLVSRLGFGHIQISRPWKLVPLSLILFQLARIAHLKLRKTGWLSRVAIPLNLFDAIRLMAIKD